MYGILSSQSFILTSWVFSVRRKVIIPRMSMDPIDDDSIEHMLESDVSNESTTVLKELKKIRASNSS